MNPYLFTVTFLLMMSFLTSSEAIRFSQSSLESKVYHDSCNYFAAAEELRELSHLEVVRGEETQDPQPRNPSSAKPKNTSKRIGRLNVNSARPPDNSRLNIYTLLHKDPHKNLPEEFSLYEVIARVMRSLYSTAPFYKPNAEYRILDQLIKKAEETAQFTTPDALASLSLDDPELQSIFYHMLNGTKDRPSLLHYLSFDKIDSTQTPSRKISLLFADPLILHAIFPDGDIADRLIEKRSAVWAEILDQEAHRLERLKDECKGRQKFAADLQKALQEVLESADLKYKKYKEHVFDCGLGQPGTIIFVEDPLTHALTREKFTPPQK